MTRRLLWFWTLLWLVPAASAADWRLINVNIVDLAGAEVRGGQEVHVGDGRIQWLGAADVAPPAGEAQVVDGGGGYLLPGLIDAHVHLADPTEYPHYLAAGVTTVVELGGPDRRSWRSPLQTGELAGPRLFTCGPTITAPDAATARAAVAQHAQAGYDCIKIYDDMPTDVYTALTSAARERSLPSAAHIPRNLAWADMLKAAPSAVAHAEEFLYSPCCTEAELKQVADTMRERGIALITTLTTYDNITRQATDLELFLARQPAQYYPAVNFRAWRLPINRYAGFDPDQVGKMRSLFRFQSWLVNYLHEADVRIVLGTDAGNTGTFPGISVAEELRWLVAAGLTPAEALTSATSTAAHFLGRGDELGLVDKGALADLLLIDGNPLGDISNVRFVRGVMAAGRWYDRPALKAMREASRQKLAAEHEFVSRLDTEGLEAALVWLGTRDRPLRFGALNELGYQKLKLEEAPAMAVAVFRANADFHADNWAAHASLAEALLAVDDRTAAEQAARQVRQLAPDSPEAKQELRRLGL